MQTDAELISLTRRWDDANERDHPGGWKDMALSLADRLERRTPDRETLAKMIEPGHFESARTQEKYSLVGHLWVRLSINTAAHIQSAYDRADAIIAMLEKQGE